MGMVKSEYTAAESGQDAQRIRLLGQLLEDRESGRTTDWKGHGFSRAVIEAYDVPALAAEGSFSEIRTVPQGLKPVLILQLLTARLKSCPFKAAS
jgi:hypothetical protein